MAGYLVLEGGAEFGGKMEEPDRQAIRLAGGPDQPICVIPTAAAMDQNEVRAGSEARRWFAKLGATQVEVAPIIDRESANLPENAGLLRSSKLIYMLGGYTHFLAQILAGSAAWEAVLAAYAAGAVVAGSSAGAMVMCEYYYNPENGKVVQGMGLLADACVLPHHNNFGKNWADKLLALLPAALLIGIDEQTGMIDDGEPAAVGQARRWNVYGKGSVTLYRQGGLVETYRKGEPFAL